MPYAWDAAWAAGFFEGEGCISWSPPRERLPYGRWRLVIKLTDLDVLERFRSVVGVGTVSGPYERAGCKPHWNWTCGARREMRHVLEILLPHLGERRAAKARECLADIERRLQ